MEPMAIPIRELIVHSNKSCLICKEGEDEFNLGPLYDLEVFSVHYLCVLTGNNLYPTSPSGSLLGFLIGDIYRAYKKYISIFCEYCKKCGASLMCQICRKKYHLPCGLKNGARVQMLGRYPSYCKFCIPKIFSTSSDLNELLCAICHVSGRKNEITYWPVCCRPQQMLHFDCLKTYALKAGYLLKCPLCLNERKFRTSIRKFGIYIPNADAEWLVDMPDDEIFSRPLRCSAKICIMRPPSKITSVIVPCFFCKDTISHIECTFSSIFVCMGCMRKLFPTIPYIETKPSDQVSNLSDTFPWLFRLIENIKYGARLKEIPHKILKFFEENQSRKSVTWQDVLNCNESSILAIKLKEYYDDTQRVNTNE